MTPSEFAADYKQAQDQSAPLSTATKNQRLALCRTLSKNVLVVRNTVIREHLQSCSNHTDCGWLEVSYPNDPLNEDSWQTPSRMVMFTETAEAIAKGRLTPWTPEPPIDVTTLPFYRQR